MEEFAIDLRTPSVDVIERSRLSFRERVAAYAELTKPRITFLIVLTLRTYKVLGVQALAHEPSGSLKAELQT